MPDAVVLSAYHRQIAAARNVGLAMTRAQADAFMRILEAYAEDLAARIAAGTAGRGAAQARALAEEIIRAMVRDLALSTRNGVTLTASRAATLYADALASLLPDAGGSLAVAVSRGIGMAAAQAVLSRPELSAAFRTIRTASVTSADRIITSALLRGATSTQLGMELRLHILGSEAIPPALLLDRRRIGYAAIQAMGYMPTRENLLFVRAHAGQIANAAQLIARTEPMNAEWEAHRQSAAESDVVAAIGWETSHRHAVPDQCDVLQDTDFYGLGPGIYPPEVLPRRPHPRCICRHRDILRPVEEWGTPKPPTPALRVDPDDAAAAAGLSPSQTSSLRTVVSPPASQSVAPAAAPNKVIHLKPYAPPKPPATSKAALNKAIQVREDEIRSKSIEWATAWDPLTAQVILNKTSKRKNFVGFTDQEAALLKGTIFTHNHPSSASFSAADVQFATNNDLAEIRVAAEMYDYRLSRPAGGWPQLQDVGALYQQIDQDLYAKYYPKIQAGKLSPDEAGRKHSHELWRILFRKLGLSSSYKRAKRP